MFDRILGQGRAIEFLTRAIRSGRVAHTYAFVGPHGVGRKLTALAFAQALLCPHPSPIRGEDKGEGQGTAGCGRCPACQKVERLTHPDLHLIAPDGQNIKIEQVRELEREAALHPVEGAWKVFIIDEAERMMLPTANALLKTLEEPPPRTLLILILSQAQALPPTVLSRCQVVRFLPLAEDEAAELFCARGYSASDATRAARSCQGQVGLALGEKQEEWERRAEGARLLEEIKKTGGDLIFRRAETLGRDRESVEALITGCWLWYRDLLVVRAGGDQRLIIHDDRRAELARHAQECSWEAIFDALAQCRAASAALAGNASPRLTLEVTLSRLVLRAA